VHTQTIYIYIETASIYQIFIIFYTWGFIEKKESVEGGGYDGYGRKKNKKSIIKKAFKDLEKLCFCRHTELGGH
jgi:hypothetical protein